MMKFPELKLDKKILESLAMQSISEKSTVTGVQKKLSLHLSPIKNDRLTIVDYPTGYILKPQSEEYENLPQLEELAMKMADIVGISTVPHTLTEIAGSDISPVYITQRIDRIFAKNGSVQLLAMEDFCQLDERLTEDKYKGSYERCAMIIEKYSIRPGLDMAEFFYRIVFSYLIGNTDMHFKNFSLIESAPGSRQFSLSKAYDLLPVGILITEDPDEMALTLCGKKSNFKKQDFLRFASECHIAEKTSERIISAILKKLPELFAVISDADISEDQKQAFKMLIQSHAERLQR